MAKLKVFTWSDGFHAYAVATTSRAKALAAWGVARDLFKDGEARELTGGGDHDAALARPGDTIRRGLSMDVGKVSRATKPKPPSKADRERVAALKRKLDGLRAEHDDAVAALADRRGRLDDEAADLDHVFEERSRALTKRLDAAKAKLGGS